MTNPFSLANKTILVTGSSSGIGRAIAIRCSEMGAKIIVTGRNKERLEETHNLLFGDGHCIIQSDLVDKDSLRNLVVQTPELDGIVYNAGINIRIATKLIDYKDIENTMSINMMVPMVLQSELLREKKIKKSSSIVFIASRAAVAPSVGNALYSASKGAIISYSKVLALEMAPRQVRVNCICPAMVVTNLISNVVNGETLKDAQEKYPLKRYGTPDDIAYLSVYLLSNASCWMTGSCIDITGGAKEL